MASVDTCCSGTMRELSAARILPVCCNVAVLSLAFCKQGQQVTKELMRTHPDQVLDDDRAQLQALQH